MKVTNRLQLIIPIIALIFLLLGCSKQNDKKIGLLIHAMDGRWVTDVKYLEAYAKEAGLELVIKNANGDENKQLSQSKELISEGVGIIIIVAVNQNTAAGIVRNAHDSGIKVIAYDRIIKNSDLDYLITFEYYKIGEMMAKYATNLKPIGNYIELWGDASDGNAISIRKAQEDHLNTMVNNGNINVIYRSFVDDWSAVNAQHILEKVLNLSDERIDVVLASNDVIAQSVSEVFKAANYPINVLITGQDATLESCRLIALDRQSMTIYKSTKMMAKKAIDLSMQLLQNEKVEEVLKFINNGRIDVPTFYQTPTIVTASNLRETVIADGYLTEEEVYGDPNSRIN